MKFRELEMTANVVWSPSSFHPVMLATGSAAQHVDSSFSSSALLELYSLNMNDPEGKMEQNVSVPSEHKFQKLAWSTGGVLVGGCDGGLLKFYSVKNMLSKKDPLISSNTKHTGPVSAIDINPFQHNLFASGAADSEIFIWDLNNTNTPMSPGNKSQPNEHVQGLVWNRQVQHILASSFSSKCVVWDLRKNEPIIKLSDGQARTRWRAAAWHPSVATQICLASEDDLSPVIQLWDLRLATSPLMTLEHHQKGVLSLSWCQQDSDLLLSASKDGRILCWNPNNNIPGGEALSELCSTGQWMYDVQWCPKNPHLVAACSNDGSVSIYSINGGSRMTRSSAKSNIMDSFPGMENLQQSQIPSQAEVHASPQILPKPALWMKRPIRAQFGFGGKLITAQNVNSQREVFISQVVTEPDLISQARSLQEVINAGGIEGSAGLLSDYCKRRAEEAADQHDRYVWHFLKASFEQDPRAEMLNLLGFRQEDMNNKLNVHYTKLTQKHENNTDGQMENITDRISGLISRSESSETEAEPSTDTSTDISGVDQSSAFDTIGQPNKFEAPAKIQPFALPIGDDSEGLICQSLLSGNIEIAVELCMDAGRIADGLVIASTGGSEFLQRVQQKYLSSCSGAVSSITAALLDGNWKNFASGVTPNSWKAAIAVALTHCAPGELYSVCETLGEKLDKESDFSLVRNAIICYLCSVSVDKLVQRWQQDLEVKGADAKLYTKIAELVLIARLAAIQRGRPTESLSGVDKLLSTYALKLANQGFLDGALACLSNLQNNDLSYRLQCALGYAKPYSVNVRSAGPRNIQNQYATGNRIRTSSYKSTTQDAWSHAPQPTYKNPGNTVPAPGNLAVDGAMPNPYGFQQPNPSTTPQPPRPPSASSHGGLIGRSKYVRDPSVASGPPGYQPSPIDTQPMMGSRAGFIQPGVNPIQSPYNPPNFSSVPQPAQQIQTPFNVARNYNPNPVPLQPAAPAPPNILQPSAPNLINNNPSIPPVMDMSNGFNNNSNYYNQPELAAEATAVPHSAASGWNDPPPLSSNFKPHPPKDDYSSMAPITHPLFGAVAPQHIPLSGPPQYQLDQPAPMPQYSPYANPMPLQQQMQGQMQGQMPGAPPSQPVQEIVKPPTPAPVQKAPIPEQHIHMQTVFDALRAQCAQSTNNPQIKRKLDDIQKKLEVLYDLLRENKLSENAINVLHCVVQMVQSGDYVNSLAALTSLASGPDFSTVASFLPSLKIMLQTAGNLQIYLR